MLEKRIYEVRVQIPNNGLVIEEVLVRIFQLRFGVVSERFLQHDVAASSTSAISRIASLTAF